jgi:hypothetical protein
MRTIQLDNNELVCLLNQLANIRIIDIRSDTECVMLHGIHNRIKMAVKAMNAEDGNPDVGLGANHD